MQNREAILHNGRRFPPVLLVASQLRITVGYPKFLSATSSPPKTSDSRVRDLVSYMSLVRTVEFKCTRSRLVHNVHNPLLHGKKYA